MGLDINRPLTQAKIEELTDEQLDQIHGFLWPEDPVSITRSDDEIVSDLTLRRCKKICNRQRAFCVLTAIATGNWAGLVVCQETWNQCRAECEQTEADGPSTENSE